MKGISLEKELEAAYRKWKSSAYFDSFGIIEAQDIAKFEEQMKLRDSLQFFINLAEELLNEESREKCINEIINSIYVKSYPKNNSYHESNREKKNDEKYYEEKGDVISNVPSKNNSVNKIQYMIGMDIKGHILGVLWIMKFGSLLDRELGPHCFGNRLRENIVNEKEEITPFLFYPYFKKYESWRDEGISIVEKLLDVKLNAIMISLDIKGYFYNCRVDFTKLKEDIKGLTNSDPINKYDFLTDFIEKVFIKYSQFFNYSNEDNKPFIPIGFLPANIISNWYLHKFDVEVRRSINPQYYGRYVDDILFVFSIHDNNFDSLKDKKRIIEFLLLDRNTFDEPRDNKIFIDIKEKDTIVIDQRLYNNAKNQLTLQNGKIKVFYFSTQHSRELIEQFKRTIDRQASVFRYLQESDKIIRDYETDIININYSDTKNKIRSVEGISYDKFSISKWLAFLVSFSGRISSIELCNITKILFETLDVNGYLQLSNLWEKYVLFFFKHSLYDEIKRFIDSTLLSIDKIELVINNEEGIVILKEEVEYQLKNLKDTMRKTLLSILMKTLSLRRNDDVNELDEFIRNRILRDDRELFIDNYSKLYLYSFMYNTTVIPYPLADYSKENNDKYDLFNSEDSMELTISDLSYLNLYPRYIHLNEIQLFQIGYPFHISRLPSSYTKVLKNMFEVNYRRNYSSDDGKIIIENIDNKTNIRTVEVGKSKNPDTITIGIANVRINHEIFEANLRLESKFSSDTRKIATEVINSAIDQKVNFLVMPECYIHHSWLNRLIRISKDHQMAMVFGLEHVIDKQKNALNYLVTLLPFKMGKFNNCYVDIRLKKHYSPSEEKYISNYFLKVPSGKNKVIYSRYKWNGFCFSPYSCFEIACIEDRMLFKSLVDAIVIIEWNRDIEYFANIIDSLSRDIHCYCIQVNSSEYGDNRIVQPAHSFMKDIVIAKGGLNDYLIVEKVNIKQLRDFQKMDYPLQKEQEDKFGKFKPTPPGFDHGKVSDR